MSTRPLLTGNVDTRDEDIRSLNDQVEYLTTALEKERQKGRKNEQAILHLRRILLPLFQSLQMVFDVIPDGQGVGADVPPQESRVWESWKSKLGGTAAKIIEALLEHGEMSVAQIRVACHCGQQTVYDVTSKMNKLGLINKNGGRYSLKKL